MKEPSNGWRRSATVLLLLVVGVMPACARIRVTTPYGASQVTKAPSKRLAAFESDAELDEYLRRLARAREQEREEQLKELKAQGYTGSMNLPPETVMVGAESVTNVQEAGVDEGDIVKACGDYLLVLRRGRLFSVRFGGVNRPGFPGGSNR